MASTPPDAPPESIIVGRFNGLRNTVAEERLGVGDLGAAENVDIDDAGQIRRRRGRALLEGSRHHSLRGPLAGKTLVVRDGVLGFLNDSFQFAGLVSVGNDPLSYAAVGADIYFSSRVASGKIIGGQALPWGEIGGAGDWISPVMTPTDTLGAISGRVLSAPPMAEILAVYRGRMYLAAGPLLWYTELYLYDRVDKDRNYYFLEHDITMVEPVSDGLYVGTTKQLLFLKGIAAKGLEQQIIVNSPVMRGSSVTVPYSKAHPQARQGPVPEGEGPMFITGAGICLGLDGGQVYNLTQDRVVFPEAERAAALYREDQGANSYVAVADSAGGLRAGVRFGDYVDAEIVRASQRGEP